MKKLVLVLLVAATTLSVSAQRNNRHRDNDRYDRVDRYNDKHDRFDKRQKEEFRRQLERINHEYDSRIRMVKNMPLTRARVKARKIKVLENERRIALNECRARFYRQMDYAERGNNHRRK
jgi:hypothetical protein